VQLNERGGPWSQRSLAKEFGVSHVLISHMKEALQLRGLFARNIGASELSWTLSDGI
jgi:hypothetical protein